MEKEIMSQQNLNELTLEELMHQAQAIQNDMKTIHAKLINAHVVGIAGNHDIEISMNGKYEVTKTMISDNAYSNKKNLENLISAAINDAISKIMAIAE